MSAKALERAAESMPVPVLDLPKNEEAERGLLYCVAWDEECFEQALANEVSESVFAWSSHAAVWRAICEMKRAQIPTNDPTAVMAYHQDHRSASFDAHLASVFTNVLHGGLGTHNFDFYLKVVLTCHRNRGLIRASLEIQRLAATRLEDPEAIRAQAEGIIERAVGRSLKRSLVTVESLADSEAERQRHMQQEGCPPYIPTHIDEVDLRIGGFTPSSLAVIGGRPSMGKSAAIWTLAVNMARTGRRVAIISAEVLEDQVLRNLASVHSSVNTAEWNLPGSEETFQAKLSALEAIKALPIEVYESRSATGEVAAAKIKAAARNGAEVVFVDYLQRLKLPPECKGSMRDGVGENVKALKQAALDARVVVVLASQLNRDSTKNKDHRPGMEALAESSWVEQEADYILLLHRPHYYDQEEHHPEEAFWIVAKNRGGRAQEQARVRFKKEFLRFEDWDKEQWRGRQ